MRMIVGLDAPDAGFAAVNGRPCRYLPWPLQEVGARARSPRHPSRSQRPRATDPEPEVPGALPAMQALDMAASKATALAGVPCSICSAAFGPFAARQQPRACQAGGGCRGLLSKEGS